MTPNDPEGAAWRKSTHSGESGGSCVEVACLVKKRKVRDSKNKQGPTLSFVDESVDRFINGVKAGRFD